MNYSNPTIGETLLISLIGFCVVFTVLIVLMALIWVMGKVIGKLSGAPEAPAAAPAAPAAPAGVRLENCTQREAAMIMAIVADTLGKDPKELSFISIKEVKE